jgi:hypothetical protein
MPRGTTTLWTADTVTAFQALIDDGVPGLSPPSVWLERLIIAWVLALHYLDRGPT